MHKKFDLFVFLAIMIVVVFLLVIYIVPMSSDVILLAATAALVLIAFCVGLSKQVNPRTWNWILLVFNLALIIGTAFVIGRGR
ncbi:MAG: hypothetical protein AB1832_13275 [Pseudomonadota bacterium]